MAATMPSTTEMSTVSVRNLRYIKEMKEEKQNCSRKKDRLTRQAEALRANLRRRKEQARRRNRERDGSGSALQDPDDGNERSLTNRPKN